MKKIEIDLEELLGDEDGIESMQESIRRKVVESITKIASEGIKHRINEAVSQTISTQLNEYLKTALPALFEQMMDAEYVPVSDYGRRGETTTLRGQLLKSVTENMVYKPANYSHDRNQFTKAVDTVVAAQTQSFQEKFNKTVDETFTAAAFEYARKKLQEKLGIKS